MEEIRAIITQEEARIQCNFEQVEKAIQATLAEYRGAVFTEDSKAYAKKHVAGLRAQKKELQDNLKEEKKKYMRPWDELEARAKKLINMFDEPIELINGQVKAFEEERVKKKKELIKSVYEEIVPDRIREYARLCSVYNPKWENATFKEKAIRDEIRAFLDGVEKDIAAIGSMESDAVEKALSMYKHDLDLTNAISYINNFEKQKQEILLQERERRRKEEEERVRREERERILAEQRAKEAQEAAARQAELEKEAALKKAELEKEESLRKAEEEKAGEIKQAKTEAAREVIESFIPDSDGDAELYGYRIYLSADAKEKLEMYMDSVGIEWEMM